MLQFVTIYNKYEGIKMNNIELGYCIIANPFSKERETMIFVSKKDSPTLNTEIYEQTSYNEACLVLKRLGFVQTEILTFESIQKNKISLNQIKSELESHGMTYNKNLEASIRMELKSIQEETKKTKNISDPIVGLSKYLEQKGNSEIINAINEPLYIQGYQIPKYGETIELYFYLFLESTLLKEGDILFLLNGDFYNKKSDNEKKYIQIVRSKFRRINTGNDKQMHFESLSKYKDFISDIDCLFTTSLEFKSHGILGQENKIIKRNYSIMEIKDSINLENYIVVDLDNITNYPKLVEFSSKIKNVTNFNSFGFSKY
jgi:hypothetical protein